MRSEIAKKISVAICIAFTVTWIIGATTAVAHGDEMPESILKYFPGQWRVEGPEGNVVGTVEWKLVAGGKAVAGGAAISRRVEPALRRQAGTQRRRSGYTYGLVKMAAMAI